MSCTLKTSVHRQRQKKFLEWQNGGKNFCFSTLSPYFWYPLTNVSKSVQQFTSLLKEVTWLHRWTIFLDENLLNISKSKATSSISSNSFHYHNKGKTFSFFKTSIKSTRFRKYNLCERKWRSRSSEHFNLTTKMY